MGLSDGPGFDLPMMFAVMRVELKKYEFPYFVNMFYRTGVLRYVHFLLPARRVYETCRGIVKIDEPIWLSNRDGRKSFDARAVFRLLNVNEKPVKNFRQYMLALWAAGVSAYSVDVISRQVTYYSGVNDTASAFNWATRITCR